MIVGSHLSFADKSWIDRSNSWKVLEFMRSMGDKPHINGSTKQTKSAQGNSRLSLLNSSVNLLYQLPCVRNYVFWSLTQAVSVNLRGRRVKFTIFYFICVSIHQHFQRYDRYLKSCEQITSKVKLSPTLPSNAWIVISPVTYKSQSRSSFLAAQSTTPAPCWRGDI